MSTIASPQTASPAPSGTLEQSSLGGSETATVTRPVLMPLSGPALDVLRAWVGAVFCLIFVAFQQPRPLSSGWGEALLLLAPLSLIPLTVVILQKSAPAAAAPFWALVERFELSAGVVLIGSYLLPPMPSTAALVLPWLALTLIVAWCGVIGLVKREYRDVSTVTIDVGCILLAVGGLWLTAERAGIDAWGFNSVICLLTGIHFHYAGFLLLLAAGWAARELGPVPLAKAACLGVLVGVPLTAMGITASHWKLHPALEAFSACFMATAGFVVAFAHLVVANRAAAPKYVRALWTISAASLMAGMGFAALFGLRHFILIPGLDIEHMRALHGTINAIGFGLCGMIAWRLHRKGLVRS